jgi:hypothetical protein
LRRASSLNLQWLATGLSPDIGVVSCCVLDGAGGTPSSTALMPTQLQSNWLMTLFLVRIFLTGTVLQKNFILFDPCLKFEFTV